MKYRKKPVAIDAVQFNGRNVDEIGVFIGKKLKTRVFSDAAYEAGVAAPLFEIDIETLEGVMTASPNDYIIKGVKGEFYPCKPDVFEQTYENVEGEEMLTVSRKQVQNIYAQCEKIEMDDSPNLPAETIDAANTKMALLSSLFGSKCRPDDVDSSEPNVDSLEQKTAEPRFKVGDMVRFKYCCTPYRIDGFKMLDGAMLYQVGEVWAEESDLEPYTEPKGDTSPNVSHSDIDIDELVAKGCVSDPAKQFNTILKDGFSKDRRLNIAVQLTCAMIPKYQDNGEGHGLSVLNERDMIKCAYRLADMLIAEATKGGNDGN